MKSKKLVIVGSIFLLLFALVLVRSIDQNHFRNNLSKWADPTLTHKNILSEISLAKIDNPLIVILDEQNSEAFKGEILAINANELTHKKNLQKITNYKGSVVLVSEDADVSAKAWMVLSQMGVSNLFLLDKGSDEAFKYEFQPDTAIRLEN